MKGKATMKKVRVVVTVEVDPDSVQEGQGLKDQELEATALAAISNAVSYFQGNGFCHHLENQVAITVENVSLAK
jgi:hypothetical protein